VYCLRFLVRRLKRMVKMTLGFEFSRILSIEPLINLIMV